MDKVKLVLYLDGNAFHFCYLDRDIHKKAMNRAIHLTNLIKLKAKKDFKLEIKTKADLDKLYENIVKSRCSDNKAEEILESKKDSYGLKEKWLLEALGRKNG